jgi:flagellar motility protein MotE (MotC chaperone)
MSQINDAFGKPMYEADPTNAKYNSLQLQCYEQRKEIDRLNERIKRLEEAGDELMYDNDDMANINRWHKAKEAKP